MQESYKVASATENTKFRVGQTVWCLLYGKGKVIDATDWDSGGYPVEVYFESTGDSVFYTENGEYYIGTNRTLFFSEPQVIAATEPVFEPKLVGKVVLVRNLEGDLIDYGLVEVELEDYVQVDGCTYYKHRYNFHEVNPQPITFD